MTTNHAAPVAKNVILAAAAHELLTVGGRRYKIRLSYIANMDEFSHNWILWWSPNPRRGMIPTKFGSFHQDRAAAEAEIFSEVVAGSDWHGLIATPDEA